MKSKNEIDREAYVKQKNIVNIEIDKAKCTYYNDRLINANSKSIYATIHSLLGNALTSFPACKDNKKLANSFVQYFDGKISKIRVLLMQRPLMFHRLHHVLFNHRSTIIVVC